MLKAKRKFAVVCARGLGDALVSMILARNLSKAGFSVTTFSSILVGLKEWFPGYDIVPFPDDDQIKTTFIPFDTIITADCSIVQAKHHFDNELILLKANLFTPSLSMVDNLYSFCRNQLNLSDSEKENGITPPAPLKKRGFANRVIIHPLSSEEKKNWPAQRFIALAHQLEKRGFDPYFCISPAEAAVWKNTFPQDKLPLFPHLGDLATFIYESGYLIGNDSGLGHLASSLGIPTLTLFARKSYSKLWRPGWAPGLVVAPPPIILGCRLKQKLWKTLLHPGRVLAAFDTLVKQTQS